MHYVHISTLYRWTTLMFICQTVNSDRFLETLFCTRSFRSLLRFGSLNTLLTLPLEKDCVGKAKRWHYSTEWNLRFIQNVASCYVLCLTKESVNTATLIHAPVCVCVCVCAPRTPHGGPSALEISSGGGSGLNSLPVRIRTGVRTLRSPALVDPLKVWGWQYMFSKLISSPPQSCIYLIKNSCMLKYYYKSKYIFSIWIYFEKCHLFLWRKASLGFSASLFQSSVSHDSSEIILICWFAAQETFMIIINIEKKIVVVVETMILHTKLPSSPKLEYAICFLCSCEMVSVLCHYLKTFSRPVYFVQTQP